MTRRAMIVFALLLALSAVLSACAAPQSAGVALAPVSALPETMQRAPERVRTAYQFAVAHPEALENVPCYCGCGAIGHHSNLACYVKGFDADGKPQYDDHAMGCSICVDIAQDVMRMTAEGRQPVQIREEIVAAYAKFGPSNQ